MLELTENQLRQMRLHEHAAFVSRVRAELVAKFPELASDDALEQRLLVAHDRAIGFGLESAQARTQFLYQEAFAPGFDKHPAFVSWLGRPGAEPEQRWRDFIALAEARLGINEPTSE
jgi:hypothetical protein